MAMAMATMAATSSLIVDNNVSLSSIERVRVMLLLLYSMAPLSLFVVKEEEVQPRKNVGRRRKEKERRVIICSSSSSEAVGRMNSIS